MNEKNTMTELDQAFCGANIIASTAQDVIGTLTRGYNNFQNATDSRRALNTQAIQSPMQMMGMQMQPGQQQVMQQPQPISYGYGYGLDQNQYGYMSLGAAYPSSMTLGSCNLGLQPQQNQSGGYPGITNPSYGFDIGGYM